MQIQTPALCQLCECWQQTSLNYGFYHLENESDFTGYMRTK